MGLCAAALTRRGMNHQLRKKASQFDPGQDCTKVISLHANKGLELPVVSMVEVGLMPAEGDDERRRSATVLRRGYASDAAVGDWGEWRRGFRCPSIDTWHCLTWLLVGGPVLLRY